MIKFILITGLLFSNLLAAEDLYMGDYQDKEKTRTAQVIAYANGEYQANIISNFDKPWPAIAILKGVLSGDKVIFEEQESWSGEIKNGKFTVKNKGAIELKQIIRKSPTSGKKPTKGAIVLFDGSNRDEWNYFIKKKKKKSPSKSSKPKKTYKEWKLVEGNAVEITHGSGSWYTKKEFGSYKLHLEFRLPFKPSSKGQGRGNSGVFNFSRYEVQVLDSYGLEGKDNECGGIYKTASPRINMCYPPLQWQTYDITFSAPKFNQADEITSNPRITVVHNGVTVHDNLELTTFKKQGVVKSKAIDKAGIYLQNHGNPVQYRNIWIEEIK